MLFGADGKVVRHSKADYERNKAIVKKFAKPSCLNCFGRGIVGINTKTGKQVICKCVNQIALIKELKMLHLIKQELKHSNKDLPSAS